MAHIITILDSFKTAGLNPTSNNLTKNIAEQFNTIVVASTKKVQI